MNCHQTLLPFGVASANQMKSFAGVQMPSGP